MGSFSRWSAYGFVGRTTRILYFSTNLLTVILSLVVFIYGVWLYWNLAEYAELLAPSLYVDVSRIMIVVSLLAIFNSVTSVYGVFKELRCMIYSFSVASCIIFIMLFIGGIMGFVFQYKLENQILLLDLKMSTSLRELYGLDEIPGITQAWDTLQTNYKCCGVNGTNNWNIWMQSKWHMHYKPEDAKPKVPKSCCYPGKELECQDPFIDASNMTNAIYEDTCYMPLRTELLSVVHVASWLCIVESIMLLLPALFAAIYARLIKK
ncbi:Tetraspanin [Aphelenchoides besseyi]|nr:Tetraspanin [Aphelenchoides besseyi]KAI6235493.1 Tetraspanin [Aphelenchoides besseyi]